MFTGLNKQLCIFMEAAEPRIGCMGAFLASQGRKQLDEEALKGFGVLNGFWRTFFVIPANLCTVRKGAHTRACCCLINSGTGPFGSWEGGKVGASDLGL